MGLTTNYTAFANYIKTSLLTTGVDAVYRLDPQDHTQTTKKDNIGYVKRLGEDKQERTANGNHSSSMPYQDLQVEIGIMKECTKPDERQALIEDAANALLEWRNTVWASDQTFNNTVMFWQIRTDGIKTQGKYQIAYLILMIRVRT